MKDSDASKCLCRDLWCLTHYVPCQFIWGIIAKIPLLDYTTKIYFWQFWKLTSPRSRCQSQCWMRASLLVIDGWLLAVSSHGGRGKGALWGLCLKLYIYIFFGGGLFCVGTNPIYEGSLSWSDLEEISSLSHFIVFLYFCTLFAYEVFFYLLLLISATLHSVGYIFPFLLSFLSWSLLKGPHFLITSHWVLAFNKWIRGWNTST